MGFGWGQWPIATLISRARWQRFGPFACWPTRAARARGRPHFSAFFRTHAEVDSTQIEDIMRKARCGTKSEVHHLRARAENCGEMRNPSSACGPPFSDRFRPSSEDARPWHPLALRQSRLCADGDQNLDFRRRTRLIFDRARLPPTRPTCWERNPACP